MAIEKVREYLKAFHMDEKILEFDVSSATVELAAQALSCEPKRIAKTLSFQAGEEAVLIVAAGDAKVDNHKFKENFHTKAKMLSPEDVELKIGHTIGGVCPFGINEGVKVYLDASLKRFQTVYPACGSANSAIELTLTELETLSGEHFCGWIDACKGWEETDATDADA